MVIMTKDGATLFETIPRTVSFQPQAVYAAGTAGNSVYIDGMPVQRRHRRQHQRRRASSPAWSSCATASPAPCRASSTRSRAA